MNEVFERTRLLAEAIMESPEYKVMKAAEQSAEQNSHAAELMDRYVEKKNQITALLNEEKPDSFKIKALRKDMESLKAEFSGIDEVVALEHTRKSFNNLIAQVNQVLSMYITGKVEDPDETPSCPGSCEGCNLCK